MLGYVVHQRVVVNLKSGTAIRGVVVDRKRSFAVIKDAEVMEPGVQPVRADGEILVDKAEIDYVQIADRG